VLSHFPGADIHDFMGGNLPWTVNFWFKVNALNNSALGTITPLWTKDHKEE
jgi:hypothetical protein